MRKILLIITPITNSSLTKAIDSVINMMDTLGVKDRNIHIMSSTGRFKIPEWLLKEYKSVDITFMDAVEYYDDIYLIEGIDKLSNDDVNGLTYTLLQRTLEKIAVINSNESITEISSFKELIISDFVNDAIIIDNNPEKIQSFIDTYLDNLIFINKDPDFDQKVIEIKKGLRILFNKLTQ